MPVRGGPWCSWELPICPVWLFESSLRRYPRAPWNEQKKGKKGNWISCVRFFFRNWTKYRKPISLRSLIQSLPFSMSSKFLILHGEAKSYCFTVSRILESMFNYLLISKVKVKSAYEPCGSSGRSLSRFLKHEATRNISTPPWMGC